MPSKQESSLSLQEEEEVVSSGRVDNLSSAPKKPTMASQGVLLKTIDPKNSMLPPLLPGKETKK